jgi:translation initiation factor 2B subunit (eIF-2B alpha/beta/delta family)
VRGGGTYVAWIFAWGADCRVVRVGPATTGDSQLLSGPLKGKSATIDPASLPPSLTQLNLLYDLTPPSLITAVCTEVSQPPGWLMTGPVETPEF